MTDGYFFDTDCLSAFLWVRGESILSCLYGGRIVLPVQVYDELKRVPHLLERVKMMKNRDDLVVESMTVHSAEYDAYLRMTTAPEAGMRIIGRGEADGNILWANMLRKKRRLPASAFSEYIKNKI